MTSASGGMRGVTVLFLPISCLLLVTSKIVYFLSVEEWLSMLCMNSGRTLFTIGECIIELPTDSVLPSDSCDGLLSGYIWGSCTLSFRSCYELSFSFSNSSLRSDYSSLLRSLSRATARWPRYSFSFSTASEDLVPHEGVNPFFLSS